MNIFDIHDMKCGIVNIDEQFDSATKDIIQDWLEEECTFKHNHGIVEYVLFIGAQDHRKSSLDEFSEDIPAELVDVCEKAYEQGFEYLTIYLG